MISTGLEIFTKKTTGFDIGQRLSKEKIISKVEIKFYRCCMDKTEKIVFQTLSFRIVCGDDWIVLNVSMTV